jgi:putative endonuclease
MANSDAAHDDPRRVLGAWGERLAARYLQDRGVEVVDRNWRCRHGEIDIVARDGDCLVFCEVKTRRSQRFGSPVEAVHWEKAARLRRLAAAWLQEHDMHAPRVRIDVIGILLVDGSPARLRHLESVVA